MQDEDYKVSSELYEEYSYSSNREPHVNKTNVVSVFNFIYPPQPPDTDSDGDLIVSRKATAKTGIIEIEHSQSTILDLVGLQIWRGALLLADWLLHKGNEIPKNSIILELGSGVGLTSVIGSMFAPVYCTDVNKCDILKLMKSNVIRNRNICKYPVTVFELDFMNSKLPDIIEANLLNMSVIIAADVIYDDVITKAFVGTVEQLLSLSPKKDISVIVALEKRYVFTFADCDSVAPCFESFLDCLNSTHNIKYELLPIDFPQYFQYDRVKELILMKITASN